MQLGVENKKKTVWAAVLGAAAVLTVAYELLPMLMGSGSSATPASSVPAAAPAPVRETTRSGGKAAKKVRAENLDPTLRLDLLAASEKTLYEGNGRNIFVSQAEVIPQPKANGTTDQKKKEEETANKYAPPTIPQPPAIPLKFFGFASRPGEPRKIFLSQGEDVWVAGEGDIVKLRYKVIRISPNSVEMQDMVNSGPPQSIPLTQG